MIYLNIFTWETEQYGRHSEYISCEEAYFIATKFVTDNPVYYNSALFIWCQDFTWTSGDPVGGRIYTYLGVSELNIRKLYKRENNLVL